MNTIFTEQVRILEQNLNNKFFPFYSNEMDPKNPERKFEQYLRALFAEHSPQKQIKITSQSQLTVNVFLFA